MNRRDFLKRVVKSFFLLLGLSFIPSAFYLYPFKEKEKTLRTLHILDEDRLPKKGVRRVDYSYENSNRKVSAHVFLVGSKAGLIALSPVCSHLGCLISYDRNREEFICPCHGGRYDMEGRVTAGPPPAPLSRMPLEVRDGKVYIGIKV